MIFLFISFTYPIHYFLLSVIPGIPSGQPLILLVSSRFQSDSFLIPLFAIFVSLRRRTSFS